MNWKYVALHCPQCDFTHDFKRSTWWELEGIYIGLYETDDMKSRKSCDQSLIYGESKYEKLVPYLDNKVTTDSHHVDR